MVITNDVIGNILYFLVAVFTHFLFPYFSVEENITLHSKSFLASLELTGHKDKEDIYFHDDGDKFLRKISWVFSPRFHGMKSIQ